MSKKRFHDLLDKRFESTLSPEEKEEFLALYRTIGYKSSIYPDDPETVEERLLARANSEISTQFPRRRRLHFWRYAAASMLLVVSVAYFLVYKLDLPKQHKSARYSETIVPGSNTATLTLGNGKTILLNAIKGGKLAVQGNTIITKNSSGLIVYETLAGNPTAKVEYNTVTTPKGGQFMIVLPDKSQVWLNAASSITYPSAFAGKERKVTLHGEAYFEITKNKEQPFIVNASNTNIKVLGTHFNVMAYENEAAVATTLLEGSVALNSGKSSKMLIPGQQGLTGADGEIAIHKVDVNDVVAWKNGYFSFRNESIQTVMNKIARWYNVDIEYKGKLSDETMEGSVSRDEDISELLDYLELTDIATFKIDGRRVIVTCK